MKELLSKRLLWRGTETIRAASSALQAGEDVTLDLPYDFHHAVLSHLAGSQQELQSERVEVQGDAELLRAFGAVRGLEAISTLAPAAAAARAKVKIQSPTPMVLILLPRNEPAATESTAQ